MQFNGIENMLRANWELYLSQQLMQIHRQQLPASKRSYHIVVRKLSVEMGEVHSSSVVSLPRRSLLLCMCVCVLNLPMQIWSMRFKITSEAERS